MQQDGDSTAKRISDVRHILGVLLAPGAGCVGVALAGFLGWWLTGAPILDRAGVIAALLTGWAYPGFLVVALPMHARFLRRRSYSVRKCLLLSAAGGVVMSVLPTPLGPIAVPMFQAPVDMIGFAAVPLGTAIGIAIGSAFWLIAMWRNGYYPPVAGADAGVAPSGAAS
jgi:hypothetical protein